MSEDPRGGWWMTLPGVLTAAAALLTAVTGSAVALNQMGVLGPRVGAGSSSVSSAPDTPTGEVTGVGPSPPQASRTPEEGSETFVSTLPLNRPFRLGDASYELLGSRIEPEADGQLAVRLTVRMRSYSDFGANFWDRSFRIAVGDDFYAASGGLNEVVPGDATKRGEVLILIPESTRTAELLLQHLDRSRSVPFAIRRPGA